MAFHEKAKGRVVEYSRNPAEVGGSEPLMKNDIPEPEIKKPILELMNCYQAKL